MGQRAAALGSGGAGPGVCHPGPLLSGAFHKSVLLDAFRNAGAWGLESLQITDSGNHVCPHAEIFL
jgi:hypothetical protein